MLLSFFSVGHLLLHAASLRGLCFPCETPLEETKFSFASGYQLEKASELEMGACVNFPVPFLNLFWVQTPAGSVHAASVCLYV